MKNPYDRTRPRLRIAADYEGDSYLALYDNSHLQYYRHEQWRFLAHIVIEDVEPPRRLFQLFHECSILYNAGWRVRFDPFPTDEVIGDFARHLVHEMVEPPEDD